MPNLFPMALLQSQAAFIFPDTATITPPTTGEVDSTGAQTVIYSATNTVTMACMITEAKPSVYQLFGDAVQVGTLFKLRLPFGKTIHPDAKIVINGYNYRVAKPSPRNSYQVSEGLFVILQDPA